MEEPRKQAVHVAADRDRFGADRKVFGVMPFTVKVASQDTDGGMLVIEQANAYRGGPPRHVHHDQEEWFRVVEGSYAVEVDGTVHQLGPGDSVLAPRGVSHTWALVGSGAGRMIIAFQPAGRMEAFFAEASNMDGMGATDAMKALFTAHGMTIVGPPLQVDDLAQDQTHDQAQDRARG